MKKITLLTLMMFIGLFSQAQIGMWLGGTVGFGSSSEKDGMSSSAYIFGPSAGYMLGEKAAVGLNLNFMGTTMKQNNNSEDVSKSTSYEIQPFFRYYFAGTGGFKFFGDAKVGFGGGNTTFEDNTGAAKTEFKSSNFGIELAPGVQYWFNDSWSMAASVGVLGFGSTTNGTNLDEALQTTTTDFGLLGDFSTLDFSFFWHF